VVKDGEFLGPSSELTPKIKFTTEGYTGEAEGYYAVVEKDANPPGYSDYTGTFGLLDPDTHIKEITLLETGDYDVYVIIYKDGAVSDPLKINTGSGSGNVDWIWGDEPYLSLYVASYGNDNDNPGTKAAPLATVQKALEKLASAYAVDPDWPEKGDADELSGGIIILNTVQVASQIDIDNTGTKYPPIILSDDPETPGGKLQALSGIGTQKSLLNLASGAKASLSGGLILAGTGKYSPDRIRGVAVTANSTFTMNGGEISGNSSYDGGGVYMADGATFTMNKGEISGNSAFGHFRGGGVLVDGATFTMNGGEISGNYAYKGGGVYVKNGATFTMNKGVISGNSFSADGGGGVYLWDSNSNTTFTMNGGEISGNFAVPFENETPMFWGGGVYITGVNATFTMNNGVISGNHSVTYGGGVCMYNGTLIMKGGVISGNSAVSSGGGINLYGSPIRFEKTGGTIYGYDPDDAQNSNVVKDSGGDVQINRGHAVLVMSTGYSKEITVGPEDELHYRYPTETDISGW
jgi:hypothetical protein